MQFKGIFSEVRNNLSLQINIINSVIFLDYPKGNLKSSRVSLIMGEIFNYTHDVVKCLCVTCGNAAV